jgi:ribose transport system permease protein
MSRSENRLTPGVVSHAHRSAWKTLLSFLRSRMGPSRISALYLTVLLVLLFGVWIPETYLTITTFRSILNNQAITAIIAIGLVAPLAAGLFDLSIGFIVGTAAILVAWAQVDQGVAWWLTPVLGLAIGLTAGFVNGVLVIKARIDSFIATLGVGSILGGFILAISGNQQIVGLDPSFSRIASTQVLGLTLPVYLALALAIALWYLIEHTPAGRRIHATGGGLEAARLSGVNVNRYILGALLISGSFAAIGGVLVTARVSAGSPGIGPPFLLPAFAAAFLGATQVRPGHFNVWGTVLALILLGVGAHGLALGTQVDWASGLFEGTALLIAVGATRYQRRRFHTDD